MATAFTPKEKELIDQKLQEAALECVTTLGMRRTTVDELARRAAISKGAFYSFYKSKEHLFLTMLEQVHAEIYDRAKRVFEECAHLPSWQRAAAAVKELFRATEEMCILPFTQGELPLLLRRLPEALLRGGYHSDEEHIQQLLSKSGLRLTLDLDAACAIIRLMMLSLLFREDIGPGFEQAMDVLIDGACKEFVV